MSKGFKKTVKFINQKIGPERRQEFLDEIDYKGSYLPKSIFYEDIDKTFIEFVDNILELTIDGEKVPVIFLTIQKWAEFSKTWDTSDKFKNIKMPFITIVRQPDIQVGTNQAGVWNIPGHKLFSYLRIPTFENGRKGIDTYKIPQPTSVDVTYEVRLFCNRMRDLNIYNRIVQLTFQSRQFYVKVNGHPMPIHLESIGDESQVDDFERRKFYVQHFEMKILGYILDENDFEVIPSINRTVIFTDIIDKEIKPKIVIRSLKDRDEISLNIVIKANNFNTEYLITPEYNIQLNEIEYIENASNVNVAINGILQSLPFNVDANQTMVITVDRNQNLITRFNFKGFVK